jgi:nucleotide-binding universal stress UspA family protein
MIKKILVALDPDTDTPVATRYASDIARRYDAQVTGLAVVDMGSIEASSRGGGIGSMYLMEKVQANLTAEARAVARELTDAFQEAMKTSGVSFDVQVEEGVPFERIVEDMKYSDLLIVGKDPHFFYSHRDQKTKTLDQVVKNTIGPTLVVPNAYRPVNRALIAYDASNPSARALRRFVHLQPFGTDLPVEIVNVHGKGEREGSQLALRMAKSYMDAYGYNVQTASIQGTNPVQEIVEYAQRYEADVVVAGAHSVSQLTKLAFGSTTASLLDNCPVPLFLDN